MLQQTQVATVLDYYPRFLARFARRARAGRRAARRCARAVERSGLLQPCASSAPMRAGRGGRARRRLPAQRRGTGRTARYRPFDCRGDRGLLLRRARRDPRRQRQACADPRARLRRRPCRRSPRTRAVAPGRGAAAAECHRGLHAGLDGSGRDAVQCAPAGLRRVPAASAVRRASRRRARTLPCKDAQVEAYAAQQRNALAQRRRSGVAGAAPAARCVGGAVDVGAVRLAR